MGFPNPVSSNPFFFRLFTIVETLNTQWTLRSSHMYRTRQIWKWFEEQNRYLFAQSKFP